EYYIRGRGYIKKIEDIENIVLKVENGTPIYLKNVGNVHLGGDIRRGVAELDGRGEVVGGIIVMRYGENALNVIDAVKKKIEEIKPSLPPGVRIVPVYDRSDLIRRAIATLREKLIEESIVVALVCLVFLWHVRSALVAIITLPIAIILSFIPMWWMHVTSNIMSLGGIAIAIGAMVDSAIIMIENAHKQLEHFRETHKREPNNVERIQVIIAGAKGVLLSRSSPLGPLPVLLLNASSHSSGNRTQCIPTPIVRAPLHLPTQPPRQDITHGKNIIHTHDRQPKKIPVADTVSGNATH